MDLDNFNLEEYSPLNIGHKTVIIKLYNDINSRKYLGDLEYAISSINQRKESDYLHNYAYIAYYNERPIGYISLAHKEKTYEVTYGIIPEERGYHLGSLLLQEFTEKVFEEIKDIDKLTLIINHLNTGSINTAKLAGYNQEEKNRFTKRR